MYGGVFMGCIKKIFVGSVWMFFMGFSPIFTMSEDFDLAEDILSGITEGELDSILSDQFQQTEPRETTVQIEHTCSKWCKKKFSDTTDLKMHEEHQCVEPYDNKVMCCACGLWFKKLTNHIGRKVCERYVSANPYACDQCKRRFKIKDHLEIHQKTCTLFIPRHCPNSGCIKTFNTLNDAQDHEKQCSNEKKNSKELHCKICKQKFTKDNLQIHERYQCFESHGQDEEQCLSCGQWRVLGSKHVQLSCHRYALNNPYQCTICYRRFDNTTRIGYHQETCKPQLKVNHSLTVLMQPMLSQDVTKRQLEDKQESVEKKIKK